jgi:hypothetical protein
MHGHGVFFGSSMTQYTAAFGTLVCAFCLVSTLTHSYENMSV